MGSRGDSSKFRERSLEGKELWSTSLGQGTRWGETEGGAQEATPEVSLGGPRGEGSVGTKGEGQAPVWGRHGWRRNQYAVTAQRASLWVIVLLANSLSFPLTRWSGSSQPLSLSRINSHGWQLTVCELPAEKSAHALSLSSWATLLHTSPWGLAHCPRTQRCLGKVRSAIRIRHPALHVWTPFRTVGYDWATGRPYPAVKEGLPKRWKR